MTIAADDVIRVAVEYDMPESQKAFNVLGMKCISGTCTDLELLTALATYVNGAWATLAGSIHNQVELASCRVTKMSWQTTEWVVSAVLGSFIPSFTPTDANDMLPHAVSGVIVMPTVKPTSRGRINIPGIGEDRQADSLLTSAGATALANFAVAIRTAIAPGTASLYYAVLGNDGTARTSTSADVNGILGSQRRRKPGVGI